MNSVPRGFGLAAVGGGALRIANSFTGNVLSDGVLTTLYFVTDIFLLTGIAGLWWRQRAIIGLAGTAGIVIFIAGIVLIRLSALHVEGLGYQLGAAVALIGLAVYSLEALVLQGAPQWAPILWLLSLVLGVGAMLGAPVLIVLSGLVFGLGFVAMGSRLLRS